eukprot:TRINITY_DN23895_c0_g1_i1.p1 TRINITY_DN23895_c0_g1~~TRINITY_DN23895_c0_g1_i1.p1  ORF type:complete len:591 (+),score=79.11 TRINITY_DN23895_c0_g1_i1:76-1773(+)
MQSSSGAPKAPPSGGVALGPGVVCADGGAAVYSEHPGGGKATQAAYLPRGAVVEVAELRGQFAWVRCQGAAGWVDCAAAALQSATVAAPGHWTQQQSARGSGRTTGSPMRPVATASPSQQFPQPAAASPAKQPAGALKGRVKAPPASPRSGTMSTRRPAAPQQPPSQAAIQFADEDPASRGASPQPRSGSARASPVAQPAPSPAPGRCGAHSEPSPQRSAAHRSRRPAGAGAAADPPWDLSAYEDAPLSVRPLSSAARADHMRPPPQRAGGSPASPPGSVATATGRGAAGGRAALGHPASGDARLAALGRRLRSRRAEMRAALGRDPTRADLDADPAASADLRAYEALLTGRGDPAAGGPAQAPYSPSAALAANQAPARPRLSQRPESRGGAASPAPPFAAPTPCRSGAQPVLSEAGGGRLRVAEPVGLLSPARPRGGCGAGTPTAGPSAGRAPPAAAPGAPRGVPYAAQQPLPRSAQRPPPPAPPFVEGPLPTPPRCGLPPGILAALAASPGLSSPAATLPPGLRSPRHGQHDPASNVAVSVAAHRGGCRGLLGPPPPGGACPA